MTDFKYPGYVPMTDDDFEKIDIDTGMESIGDNPYPRNHYERRIEQAVLARLPKPDTAERDALVAELVNALTMVLDDPDALDGRPRTAEVVHEALSKAKGDAA